MKIDHLVNPVLERMQSGGVALGMSVRLSRSADVARIAKSTGHDFVFIDTQHSIFDVETIGHIAQTALSIGVAPIVRVRGVDDPDVSLLLDNGVTGIVFPDINNADEARRAVDIAKFAPIGARSVSGGYPHFDFGSVPMADAMSALNASTLVVAMVETAEGLDNLEQIAAVDGVDVIHIGTNDLLVALGKPGRYDDPQVSEIYDRMIAATRANGKFAGAGGNRDVGRQLEAIRRGVQFLTTQTDIGFLSAAAGEWAGAVRGALAEQS